MNGGMLLAVRYDLFSSFITWNRHKNVWDLDCTDSKTKFVVIRTESLWVCEV
jgi:hypothetical protein